MNKQNHHIDPNLTIGLTTLWARDLERLTQFYENEIGLSILESSSNSNTLGIAADNRPILRLVSKPQGKAYPRSTGLFHLAILLPTRADLGQWLRHYAQNHKLDGAGDHLVSEALYLNDPEGNGLEIYWDRPCSGWTIRNGQIQMDTLPVDIPGVLAAAPDQPFTKLPSGTTAGHIHLQVDNVPKARAFYHQVLGFAETGYFSDQAGFFGAGGYHHHIGSNIWNSRGATPPPADALGLDHYELLFSSREKLNQTIVRLKKHDIALTETNSGVQVKDPAGNQIVLKI